MKSKIPHLLKSLAVATVSLTLANGSASAQSSQSFEPPFAVNSTNSIGDVGVRSTYQGFAPPQGTSQLLLTTINQTGQDGVDGYVRQSTNDAVSSVSLAGFLPGVSTNTIRNGPDAAGQEGSAFKMEITMAVGQILTFDFTFLTDANSPGAGFSGTDANDFAFATLSLGGSLVQYSVIADADDAQFTTPDTGVFDFTNRAGADPGSRFTFVATTGGVYTLGIGVADATGTTIASGLLVDNITVVPEPSTYALLAGGALLLIARRRARARARS